MKRSDSDNMTASSTFSPKKAECNMSRTAVLLADPDKKETGELKKLLEDVHFKVIVRRTTSDAIETVDRNMPPLVISKLGASDESAGIPLIHHSAKNHPKSFRVIYSQTACTSAKTRMHCFDIGASMVTTDLRALKDAASRIGSFIKCGRKSDQVVFSCPWCDMPNLSEEHLWIHAPLYHINEPNRGGICPCCQMTNSNMQVHIRNSHGPCKRGQVHSEFSSNRATELHAFGLIVVRHPISKKYLIVQEFANSGYWLPGGRVERGENFQSAARRECVEEAGIDVNLLGVLQVQFTPSWKYSRMRVIFFAEPIDSDQHPKTLPCYESVGALYESAEEILNGKLKWRGHEVKHWVKYLENGGVVSDMSVLACTER